MKLMVFIREKTDPPSAKEVANQFTFSVIYDLDKNEGLEEAKHYKVIGTPWLILVDDTGQVVQFWPLHVPRPTEIANYSA